MPLAVSPCRSEPETAISKSCFSNMDLININIHLNRVIFDFISDKLKLFLKIAKLVTCDKASQLGSLLACPSLRTQRDTS